MTRTSRKHQAKTPGQAPQKPGTRARIIEAADRLFYEQGYEHTSFADIAGAVNLSRGNFYYHFKTKDEILDAVIAHRLTEREIWLAEWERENDDPVARIRRFIDILIMNRDKILRYGCPLGSLSTELTKLDHPLQGEAGKLFTLFRTWLARQFALAGQKRGADRLAMHLLALSQGIATLANTFHDETFIRREVRALYTWLDDVTGKGNAGA
ncbi:TetR/AcrR family transcriptional regulator [Tepidicaulis marinus]|nr:TetR/AcrR family transcriptional regulator [Tepidicaulis marinus]